jgi:hypothetical protein
MWCKEGTKIIEIQDEKALHKKVYPLLSNNLKLKHEVYVANTVQKDLNGAKPIGTKRWQMVDFEIDIPDLIRHLD